VQVHLQLHFVLLEVLDVALARLMAEFTQLFLDKNCAARGQGLAC
jgi:hypothetical protein